MGLLTTGGAPMRWGSSENNAAIPQVREHGIKQFVNIYRRYEHLDNCEFLWGDEIEGFIVHFPRGQKKTIKLSLTAHEILQALEEDEASKGAVTWHPEYGSFMVESTPAKPYSSSLDSLIGVERNMKLRYASLAKACGPDHAALTLVSFPLLGVGDFVEVKEGGAQPQVRGEFSDSLFIPDECINGTHPRFGNLTRNIRLRRGRKVCIQVPMFLDEHTLARTVDKVYRIDAHPMNKAIDCAPVQSSKSAAFSSSSDDDVEDKEAAANNKKKKDFDKEFSHLYTPATDYYYGQYMAKDGEDREKRVKERYAACPCPVPSVHHPCVYMDCMAFGMGNSCLQVTMQAKNVNAARHLFDQLTVLCPMFLAATAATPIQKGILCDSDVRWLTIAASVDDRQRSEVPRIIKSRYDHVSLFISPRTTHLDFYNDTHVETNPDVLADLKKEGFDDRLARHVAHLFIRDPLVIFDGRLNLDDDKDSDHFENIQSTNWQTVRFKPPPFNSPIGWRVEFRVMEIQPTAFENAAFSVFLILVAQAIIKYDLFLVTPMSLVDSNMGRAHIRDPVKQKYWFRKKVGPEPEATPAQSDFCEKTMDEIFNDPTDGLVTIVRRLMKEEGLDKSEQLNRYVEFVSRRAAGTVKTTATFLRDFVRAHPSYAKDSRVTEEIAHDLGRLAENLALGEVAFDDYLPASLMLPQRDRKRLREE